jgi:hypothetical protein
VDHQPKETFSPHRSTQISRISSRSEEIYCTNQELVFLIKKLSFRWAKWKRGLSLTMNSPFIVASIRLSNPIHRESPLGPERFRATMGRRVCLIFEILEPSLGSYLRCEDH